jgi:hypothetical protein
MKPLASPALTRPFVEPATPAAARAWPPRLETVEPEQPRRIEPRGETEAAKRHIDQLAAHLRILQTSGAANPAMAAMLAYEMRAALGAYAAAGAVAPSVVGLEGLRARVEAAADATGVSPRRVSIVA